MLQCDVAPPVFKAQSFPGAPQQIIFLVSPAGKETPSLLGFGCHITLKDARANSTFPSVPTGKVRIRKASDPEIRGGWELYAGVLLLKIHQASLFFSFLNFLDWKLDFVPVFNKGGYILHFPSFSFIAKLHHHTLSAVLYLCLSSVDIMTDLDSYYCFQSPSPSKVIGQNPKVVLGFHFVRGSGGAACGVNNNLVCVLQLLHNGLYVNLLWHRGLSLPILELDLCL